MKVVLKSRADGAGVAIFAHPLDNEHTGICMPQAVNVQVVRQAVLPQNHFEPVGEGTWYHEVAIGLLKQVIVLCQFIIAPLFFLPLALLFPGTQQLAEIFG